MDAYWIITAFVVIDTLMEHLGHRTPPNPPARGGGLGGCARPRLRDSDDCGRRRQGCWPSSRTGGVLIVIFSTLSP